MASQIEKIRLKERQAVAQAISQGERDRAQRAKVMIETMLPGQRRQRVLELERQVKERQNKRKAEHDRREAERRAAYEAHQKQLAEDARRKAEAEAEARRIQLQ